MIIPPLFLSQNPFSFEAIALDTMQSILADVISLTDDERFPEYYEDILELLNCFDLSKFEIRDQYIATINHVATRLAKCDKSDQAITYCNETYKMAVSKNYHRVAGWLALTTGFVYNIMKDFRQELSFCNLAIPHMETAKDNFGKALVLIEIASDYVMLNENENALNYCNQAYEVLTTTENWKTNESTPHILSFIGATFDKLGHAEKAKICFDLLKEIEDSPNNVESG
jgi:tetratricopeptide (TPR) repeat protein